MGITENIYWKRIRRKEIKGLNRSPSISVTALALLPLLFLYPPAHDASCQTFTAPWSASVPYLANQEKCGEDVTNKDTQKQAEAQWHNYSLLQPLTSELKQSSVSASQVAGTTVVEAGKSKSAASASDKDRPMVEDRRQKRSCETVTRGWSNSIFILRQSLALSPRLECSGTITARCSPNALNSTEPPASVSQKLGPQKQLILNFCSEAAYSEELLQFARRNVRIQRDKEEKDEEKGRTHLALLPKLECGGVISAHCNFCLPHSSNSPAAAFLVPGTTGVHTCTWLIFVFLIEMGFHHIGQAGLKFLTSGDPLTSASQSAKIIGMSHRV
ncbi:hypothetical protein AAY473_038602 [Plecturocebus cupreus]